MDDDEAQFLNALYAGVMDDAALKRALLLAQALFDCRAGALVSLDAQASVTDLTMVSGAFDDHILTYLGQFAAIDPAPAMLASIPGGGAAATDRLFSKEVRDRHPFIQEFFRPIGLTETLGGNLFSDQARFSIIGLQRGDDRAPFDDDDIARLERLTPHLARALQLRRSFFRVQGQMLAMQTAIDRMPTGVALIDSEGGAVFANAALRRIAQRGDGLSLDRTGKPLPANLAARQRCDALLQDVAAGGPGGLATAPRGSGARDYVLLVAPGVPAFAELAWDRRGRAGAIMLVHDPDSRARSPAELLEQALHLPKGAARLLAGLAADDDLKSFAEREGVTIHTARFHLRTALARTGTRTQAELVRLAVRILRDLAAL